MTEQSPALDNLLNESRTFTPSEEFAAEANAKAEMYAEADADREAFWAKQAERLHWDTQWNRVLDWTNAPFAKWFIGGKLNVAYNCVDRHVEAGHGDQVAIHWVGEPGDTHDITYADLKREVSKAANAFTSLGLVAGDRVAIQLQMIPEAIIAMLACARLGVLHNVVFGGFSPTALRARVDDAAAKVVISERQEKVLRKLSTATTVAKRLVQRATTILLAFSGVANQDIASQLCISKRTVETHRGRIMRKLHVHSATDLVRLAARHGLLDA